MGTKPQPGLAPDMRPFEVESSDWNAGQDPGKTLARVNWDEMETIKAENGWGQPHPDWLASKQSDKVQIGWQLFLNYGGSKPQPNHFFVVATDRGGVRRR